MAMANKTHDSVVALTEVVDDGSVNVCSPSVGWWRSGVTRDNLVGPGQVIGWVETLGVVRAVVLPPRVRGAVAGNPVVGRVPVGYGGHVITLRPLAVVGHDDSSLQDAQADEPRLKFRAPTSGRFYDRPAPEDPPFVSVGDVIRRGQTVCLLEIMKSFHSVVFDGDNLPAEAIIATIVPAVGDDVQAGDVIFILRDS